MVAELICLSSIAIMIPGAEASPSFTPTEYLSLSSTVTCDFNRSDVSSLPHTLVNGNPGATNALYWETNRSYLYFGNATSASDTASQFGIGRAVFRLSDPVGTSDYWQVSVTTWWAGITYLSPTWTEVGSYTLSATGVYSSGNVGVGILASDTGAGSTTIVSEQLHTSAYLESYWEINGGAPTDQPPSTWRRPATGTDWWDATTNTLTGTPWTLDEVRRMVVIVDLRFETTIFSYISRQAGSSVSLALGGVSVAIAPAAYTPPAVPSGGFILRPNADIGVDDMSYYPGTEDGYFDAVNETNQFGDGDTSYINGTWALGNGVILGFENVPSWVDDDTVFSVTAWVIARETVDSSYPLVTALVRGSEGGVTGGTFSTLISYANRSVYAPVNPDTNLSWTVDQVNDLTMTLAPWWAILVGYTGECRITQVALLVVPVTQEPGGSTSFADVFYWLGAGGGFFGILGAIGFFGMVAIPIMAAYAYREGAGGEIFVGATITFVLFLGFFLTSLWAG